MKRALRSKNSILPVTLSTLLITCLLAGLIVIPAFADDAGWALRFDGATDYVELPPTATIFAAGWETTKSVSLWVNPDGTQTDCIVEADLTAVSHCDSIFGDRPTFWGIAIGYLTGKAQNRIWVWNYDNSVNTPYDIIGVEYTPGVWTHITLVHSGGILRAFKNGVEVGNTPSGATIVPPGDSPVLNLGGIVQNLDNKWLFQGDIDEVSLWDRALTGPEILANMYLATPTDTTSLAAFYRMSDGVGIVLTDDSGNGNTGALRDGRNTLPPDGTYPLWVDSGAFDITGPTVTINKGATQADPTKDSPITFDVVFSETVTGFTSSDVVLTASTAGGPLLASVSGTGPSYTVTVTGMSSSGNVIATIPAGAAQSATLLGNMASTSTDNSVAYDITSPTVTITQAAGQTDPTGVSPINFTVTFNETVADFINTDVTLTGTAGANTVVVTGGPAIYNVAVSGMTGNGTVIITIDAGVAHDAAGNPNTPSINTDNNVTYQVDTDNPSVTINQAAGQGDPTLDSPINFTVVFTENVADFTSGDVTITGIAGTEVVNVTGSGTTYNVAVSGMASGETVRATIAAGVAHDIDGNPNNASTSTDNAVTFVLYQILLPLVFR